MLAACIDTERAAARFRSHDLNEALLLISRGDAVIQRGKPILLSGDAAPNERLTVTLGDERKTVKSSARGRWLAEFAPRPAGAALAIEVSAPDGRATADDVLVGDVWLCSGQSNMEFPVRRALNGVGEAQNASDADPR